MLARGAEGWDLVRLVMWEKETEICIDRYLTLVPKRCHTMSRQP